MQYVILILALGAGAYYGGRAAYGHVVKPVGHAVCRVATFGHKCKPGHKASTPKHADHVR